MIYYNCDYYPCAILYFSIILNSISAAEKLDEYILDYQPLSFDTHHIHSQHQRVRRSVDDTLNLDFYAYSRYTFL